MILSVSRRTDIPAFYGEWFLKRLASGFVLVPNPMNPHQASRVLLSPGLIDGIVFWTKNPAPFIDKLNQLGDYPYYFLFTVTPYGATWERFVPRKEEIIETFKRLSRQIGPDRVIWRYDPVILTNEIDETYHTRNFTQIAQSLASYTRRCIFSFLDMYQKCQRNLKGFSIREPGPAEMIRLAGRLADTARDCGIELLSCAEAIDLSPVGVRHGKCIDDELIGRICGYSLEVGKDKHQRSSCCCVESIDIGMYHTCPHICLYCYANSDAGTVQANFARHDPASPLLSGALLPGVTIVQRKTWSCKKVQEYLFEPGKKQEEC